MQETWVPSLGLEDSPGEGKGYPLQSSGWENSMDRGAWQATTLDTSKSWTRLSDYALNRLSSKKNPPANAGDVRDVGSIPGLGFSGGGHGNRLQYSCLENPMDRGVWQAAVHGVARVRQDLETEQQ